MTLIINMTLCHKCSIYFLPNSQEQLQKQQCPNCQLKELKESSNAKTEEEPVSSGSLQTQL